MAYPSGHSVFAFAFLFVAALSIPSRVETAPSPSDRPRSPYYKWSPRFFYSPRPSDDDVVEASLVDDDESDAEDEIPQRVSS